MKTKSQRILDLVPASSSELAALLRTSTKRINGLCWKLKKRGALKLSERKAQRRFPHGRAPRLWIKAPRFAIAQGQKRTLSNSPYESATYGMSLEKHNSQ